MTMTTDQIKERLDLVHIAAAAKWTAQELRRNGSARLALTPNDGTIYKLAVFDKSAPFWRAGDDLTAAGTSGLWVMLLNCDGQGYEWNGDKVEPDYAADKWTRKGHTWTGVVLALFLSELALELTEVTP